MRFVFTADIHLHNHNDKEYDESGLPMKLVETLMSIEQMCIYCKSNNIPNIVIGGDLNHTKGIASVRAFSAFKELLEAYKEITFYIIAGNHDLATKEGYETAIDLVKGPENVICFNTPEQVDNIAFVPYSTTMFDEIGNFTNCDVLVSHFGLSDAQLSNGLSIKTRLTSDDLKEWKLVLLGHYHKPQHINNVYYVGCPIPFTRAEYDEEKRFLDVDSETCVVKSIDIQGYRKYHQLIIDGSVNPEDILREAKKLQETGDFVYVRKLIKDKIVDNDLMIIDDYQKEHIVRGITTVMDVKDQMLKWLEIENIPTTQHQHHIEIGMKGINYEKVE